MLTLEYKTNAIQYNTNLLGTSRIMSDQSNQTSHYHMQGGEKLCHAFSWFRPRLQRVVTAWLTVLEALFCSAFLTWELMQI